MKKTLVLLALSASLLSAATANLPVTFTANTLAIADLQAYLIQQKSNISGALQVAMLAGDTSLTLASAPTGIPATGSFVIDSEVITYAGVSGATLTGLTRGTTLTNAANNTTAATHAVGATVSFLTYANISAWVKSVVSSAAQAAISSLGASSVLVGTQTAAITTNQTTVTTNLATAVQ